MLLAFVARGRFCDEAFIYLFGDESIISRRVAGQLASYGHVQRVSGRDAYEISVVFAGFRDAGFNQGYWIGSWPRDFEWGIAEAGHNFTFVNPDDWQLAVAGSLLSHLRKHGPMILMRPSVQMKPPRATLPRFAPCGARRAIS